LTLQLLGGIGLFLLGMILLTDGLKAAAGGALRRTLERFTGGRVSAVLSGAAITALVQSSSATTLATIGFVSAGLLTFPAAVGIIFGANLGTSSTGWIVSLLGLKLQIGNAALPLIGIGALLRILGRGGWSHGGLALAGFGLIFVGIDVLQEGMASLAEGLDPSLFPVSGVGGRFLLVGLGMAMTVVMQSSSAAVATTLTALHSGALTLEQGALLVIGQNVGTTVTAGIAAVGASVAARRTAMAHVLFNVLTGLVAFVLLPQLLRLDALWAASLNGASDPAVALAAFHTTFNLLGVLLLLPVVDHFSRMVERLVPDRGPALGARLDRTLLAIPPVAVAAARRAVAEVTVVTAHEVGRALEGKEPSRDDRELLDRADEALGRIRSFLRQVESAPESGPEFTLHLSVLHALDHQDRLIETLREGLPPEGRGDVKGIAGLAKNALETVGPWLQVLVDPAVPEGRYVETEASPATLLEAAAAASADLRRQHRVRMLTLTATAAVSPDEAQLRMAAMRWADRIVYHLWRTAVHLRREGDRRAGGVPGGDGGGEGAGAYREVEG
jgi:phosphate:Na+ symporter